MTAHMAWEKGKILNPEFFTEDGESGNLKLRGGKCSLCGKVYFPFKEVCNLCFEMSNEEIALSGRGHLVSWSVARQFSVLGLKVPYCFGYIDLEEGVRVYGLIEVEDDNFDLLHKGMELEMIISFLYQNMTEEDIYTYKFAPAKQSNSENTGRERGEAC